jgi:hypothetical protein
VKFDNYNNIASAETLVPFVAEFVLAEIYFPKITSCVLVFYSSIIDKAGAETIVAPN